MTVVLVECRCDISNECFSSSRTEFRHILDAIFRLDEDVISTINSSTISLAIHSFDNHIRSASRIPRWSGEYHSSVAQSR